MLRIYLNDTRGLEKKVIIVFNKMKEGLTK